MLWLTAQDTTDSSTQRVRATANISLELADETTIGCKLTEKYVFKETYFFYHFFGAMKFCQTFYVLCEIRFLHAVKAFNFTCC